MEKLLVSFLMCQCFQIILVSSGISDDHSNNVRARRYLVEENEKEVMKNNKDDENFRYESSFLPYDNSFSNLSKYFFEDNLDDYAKWIEYRDSFFNDFDIRFSGFHDFDNSEEGESSSGDNCKRNPSFPEKDRYRDELYFSRGIAGQKGSLPEKLKNDEKNYFVDSSHDNTSVREYSYTQRQPEVENKHFYYEERPRFQEKPFPLKYLDGNYNKNSNMSSEIPRGFDSSILRSHGNHNNSDKFLSTGQWNENEHFSTSQEKYDDFEESKINEYELGNPYNWAEQLRMEKSSVAPERLFRERDLQWFHSESSLVNDEPYNNYNQYPFDEKSMRKNSFRKNSEGLPKRTQRHTNDKVRLSSLNSFSSQNNQRTKNRYRHILDDTSPMSENESKLAPDRPVSTNSRTELTEKRLPVTVKLISEDEKLKPIKNTLLLEKRSVNLKDHLYTSEVPGKLSGTFQEKSYVPERHKSFQHWFNLSDVKPYSSDQSTIHGEQLSPVKITSLSKYRSPNNARASNKSSLVLPVAKQMSSTFSLKKFSIPKVQSTRLHVASFPPALHSSNTSHNSDKQWSFQSKSVTPQRSVHVRTHYQVNHGSFDNLEKTRKRNQSHKIGESEFQHVISFHSDNPLISNNYNELKSDIETKLFNSNREGINNDGFNFDVEGLIENHKQYGTSDFETSRETSPFIIPKAVEVKFAPFQDVPMQNNQKNMNEQIDLIKKSSGKYRISESDENQETKIIKNMPIPYTIPIEKELPIKVEVPVDKPYKFEVPKPYPITVHNPVPYQVRVPVPKPYIVEQNIPVPVKIPIDKPYPVSVEKPYPVYIEKKVPYTVIKHIPYAVKVPVDKPVPYHVPVEKVIPYPVERKIPVPVNVLVDRPVPIQIEKPIPVSVEKPVAFSVERPVPLPQEVPVEVQVAQVDFNVPHEIDANAFEKSSGYPNNQFETKFAKNYFANFGEYFTDTQNFQHSTGENNRVQ